MGEVGSKKSISLMSKTFISTMYMISFGIILLKLVLHVLVCGVTDQLQRDIAPVNVETT